MTFEEVSQQIINENDLSDDSFAHYGVLGMKWGVRKDRRRKGETDADYKERMNRNERLAKQRLGIKSREKMQRQETSRQIKVIREEGKAQREREKQLLSSQERQEETRAKVEKKKSKVRGTVRTMTDQELSDAIIRLQKEKQYKDLKGGAGAKIVKFGESIAGGVAKNIAVKYITDYSVYTINKKFPNASNWSQSNQNQQAQQQKKKKP